MGATCSSCCWSDRRASDVLIESTLQDKLLDASGNYDGGNSTLIEDSPGNPYARSESRMKASWPRPEASPTSVYTHDDHDDDDDVTDHSECDSDVRSSSMSAHSMTGHAWNVREAESASDSIAHTEQLSDDDDGSSNAPSGYALRAARAISAAQSVRSSTSDSYASTRNLQTYESQLFADDPSSRSPTHTASQGSDEDDDDEDRRARASTSAFSDRQLSPSRAPSTSSTSTSTSHAGQRKRSY